jgi:hypothetical protein
MQLVVPNLEFMKKSKRKVRLVFAQKIKRKSKRKLEKIIYQKTKMDKNKRK